MSFGTDSPDVVGYRPPATGPIDYQAVINSPGALAWRTSMPEKSKSIIEHGVIEWIGKSAQRGNTFSIQIIIVHRQVGIRPRRCLLLACWWKYIYIPGILGVCYRYLYLHV